MEAWIRELRREAHATRRVLERVPEDRFGWRPHPKSMSLGQLALHVATLPGDTSMLAQMPEFDAAQANFDSPVPDSKAQVLDALERSVEAAAQYFAQITASDAASPWRLTFHGREIFAMPREQLVRDLLLNHWYHHRGQLTVYLRLLDIPVPAVYGRSADENPFAGVSPAARAHD